MAKSTLKLMEYAKLKTMVKAGKSVDEIRAALELTRDAAEHFVEYASSEIEAKSALVKSNLSTRKSALNMKTPAPNPTANRKPASEVKVDPLEVAATADA